MSTRKKDVAWEMGEEGRKNDVAWEKKKLSGNV
jgi:hypothetical protein